MGNSFEKFQLVITQIIYPQYVNIFELVECVSLLLRCDKEGRLLVWRRYEVWEANDVPQKGIGSPLLIIFFPRENLAHIHGSSFNSNEPQGCVTIIQLFQFSIALMMAWSGDGHIQSPSIRRDCQCVCQNCSLRSSSPRVFPLPIFRYIQRPTFSILGCPLSGRRLPFDFYQNRDSLNSPIQYTFRTRKKRFYGKRYRVRNYMLQKSLDSQSKKQKEKSTIN